jgi:hypothetical protein
MGSGASQEKIAVEDNSDSFHILELHMPTLGVGILCLIILLIVALAVWCVRKRKLKRKMRSAFSANPTNIFDATPPRPDHSAYIPMSPLPNPIPNLSAQAPPHYATLNPRSNSGHAHLYPSVPRESNINLTLDPQTIRDFFRPHRHSILADDKAPPKDDRWPYV